MTLRIDLNHTILKTFVEMVLKQSLSIQQPTIAHNERFIIMLMKEICTFLMFCFRLLYDPEFDDNLNKTMIDLMIFHNTVLTISDEDHPRIITLVLSQR